MESAAKCRRGFIHLTFVFDIFERLPVDKLDNVATSQRLVDNLQQEHATTTSSA
jgi:hypothetical protein